MQFTRGGNRLMVSHVTGPTHNFLEFTFERTNASAEDMPLIVFDQPTEDWPIAAVKQAIFEGIAENGGCDGLVIRSIRILGGDTPTAGIYRRLARCLVEHVREELQTTDVEALG